MAQALEDLIVEEISLVEDPANEDARVVIMKARGDENPAGGSPAALQEFVDMNLEQIQEALDSAEQRIEAVTKSLEKKDEEIATLRAEVEARDATISELKAAAPAPAQTEEEVMKSLPEPVRERLQKAKDLEAKVAAMEAATLEREAIDKAREAGLPQPDKLGPALSRVAKGKSTEDDAKLIESALKGTEAVRKASDLFAARGKSGGTEGTAYDVIVQKARTMRDANPKLTEAQAIDAVMRAEPQLYDQYKYGA